MEEIPGETLKIPIAKEDFLTLRKILQELPEEDRQRISDYIRERNLLSANITPEDRDFILIIAFFTKTTTNRDRRMIKEIFKLDDPDISYLTDNAPPEGIIITNHNRKDTTRELQQPDMFPDLKPTIVEYKNEHQGRSDKTNISISKVAQKVTAILNNALTLTPIIVSGTGKKRIETFVSLSVPEGINLPYPVSFFDRIVEDAIGNLVDQGCSNITAAMVYKQIHGNTGKSGIDKTTTDRINRSIKRLATTWIKMDCTAQLQAVNPKAETGVIYRVILPAEYIYIRFSNGTITDGWKIIKPPAIYDYSKMVKQIATIPTAILQTKEIHNTTGEITAAKYYLISQIERIRRKPEQNRILLETLFSTIGDTAAMENRTIKKRRVAAICGILDFFRDEKYIRDYEITTKHRGEVDGFTISVYDKNTKKIE